MLQKRRNTEFNSLIRYFIVSNGWSDVMCISTLCSRPDHYLKCSGKAHVCRRQILEAAGVLVTIAIYHVYAKKHAHVVKIWFGFGSLFFLRET